MLRHRLYIFISLANENNSYQYHDYYTKCQNFKLQKTFQYEQGGYDFGAEDSIPCSNFLCSCHNAGLNSYTLTYRLALLDFRLALRGYSGASHPRALRFALTKIFQKKKCVSIDSKCSETHRNAKEITPLTHYAQTLRALCKAQAAKRNFTYPKSLPGSQGVSMPSFQNCGQERDSYILDTN